MMRAATAEIIKRLTNGEDLVYCRLVATRGSTPQKSGAVMLVFPDGGQHGTLGGGCVEAEVKRRALGSLNNQQPIVSRFSLDHDYGWDDGLICGGRMDVVMYPVCASAPTYREDLAYFQSLADLHGVGGGGIEAVAYESAIEPGVDSAAGSSDGGSLCCIAFDDQHHRLAALATAAIPADGISRQESLIRAHLPDLTTRPRPFVEAGISYLPILPRCRLLVVGGGHVGQAVANLAVGLDFEVFVADDRVEFAVGDRFAGDVTCLSGDLKQTLDEFPVDGNTYCLVVTRGHSHDQEALYQLVDRGARYLGLIGSRRKIRLIFDNLLEEGIHRELLQQVYAPVGIGIGSQSVPEIAISIAAELVAHRNCQGEVPGRPSSLLDDNV